jgi:hypothetical protein
MSDAQPTHGRYVGRTNEMAMNPPGVAALPHVLERENVRLERRSDLFPTDVIADASNGRLVLVLALAHTYTWKTIHVASLGERP